MIHPFCFTVCESTRFQFEEVPVKGFEKGCISQKTMNFFKFVFSLAQGGYKKVTAKKDTRTNGVDPCKSLWIFKKDCGILNSCQSIFKTHFRFHL